MKYQTAQTGDSNIKNYVKLRNILKSKTVKHVACMLSALKLREIVGRWFELILISIQDSNFKQ